MNCWTNIRIGGDLRQHDAHVVLSSYFRTQRLASNDTYQFCVPIDIYEVSRMYHATYM